MLIINRNPLVSLVAVIASVAIFAVVYFTAIKPSTDTANSVLKSSEQQVQQAVRQTNRQTHGAVPTGVRNLAGCLVAAGSDTGKIAACQVKFNR